MKHLHDRHGGGASLRHDDCRDHDGDAHRGCRGDAPCDCCDHDGDAHHGRHDDGGKASCHGLIEGKASFQNALGSFPS